MKRKNALNILSISILSCALFISCNRQKDKPNDDYSLAKNILVPTGNITNEINLSEIIDSVKYVKLKSDSNYLIGHIDQIFFDNNLIFIVDKRIAESIFVFDKAGNFVTKIGSKGKGPNEFLEIQHAIIDKLNKHFVILDLKGRKLNFYNYSGVYLFSKKLPFLFSSMENIEGESFAFSTETGYSPDVMEVNNYYLITGNLDGHIFSKSFRYEESERDFSYFNSTSLRSFNDIVYFYPRYSDIIYQVKKEKSLARYKIDFQGKGIPQESKENLDDEKFKKLISRYPYFDGDYVDVENMVYFKINYPTLSKYLFFSKKTNKILFGSTLLSSKPFHTFFKEPIASYGKNTFVAIYEPKEILEMKNSYLKYTKDSKEKELLTNLKEDDNQIIFFFTVKSF